MYQKKNMFVFALLFLAGIGIVTASVFTNDQSWWGGFGGGMVGVGGMKLLQGLRYRKNEDFAREVDTGNQDERNRFLTERAKSWTCSITFLMLGISCMILRLAKLYAYSNLCAFTICGMLAVYCLAYWLLRKKY